MGCCSSVESPLCEILPEALRRPLQVKVAATVLFSLPTGSKVESAYHTSLIVDDQCEYVFNELGVMRLDPLESHAHLGTQRSQVVEVGHSRVTMGEMIDNVCPHFRPGTYDLIKKNCNSFTDCALFFLLGTRLDARYRQLERFCKWGHDSFGLLHALRLVGMQYQENPEAADFKAGIVIEKLAKVRGIEAVRHRSRPDPSRGERLVDASARRSSQSRRRSTSLDSAEGDSERPLAPHARSRRRTMSIDTIAGATAARRGAPSWRASLWSKVRGNEGSGADPAMAIPLRESLDAKERTSSHSKRRTMSFDSLASDDGSAPLRSSAQSRRRAMSFDSLVRVDA